MLTTTCEQDILWLGLRFAVPSEWQVVRHSLTPRRGGLVLVDRYRQRMQLNWTTLPGEPDLARMIEDYRAKQLEAQPEAQLEDLGGPGDWVGVTRRFRGPDSGSRGVRKKVSSSRNAKRDASNTVSVTRAVRYDESSGRVLEAIVSSPPEEDGLLAPLLSSIEAVEPIDAVTRLRCFDLDVTTPSDWLLAGTQIKPADVLLRYRQADAKGRETRQELTVRRMGMADTWWHGDAERFIRRTSPKVRFMIDERTYGGRTVTRGVGVEPGPRGKRMLGLLRRREDLLWHDAVTNAVFHVVVLSWPKRSVTPDLFGIEDGSGWRDG